MDHVNKDKDGHQDKDNEVDMEKYNDGDAIFTPFIPPFSLGSPLHQSTKKAVNWTNIMRRTMKILKRRWLIDLMMMKIVLILCCV